MGFQDINWEIVTQWGTLILLLALSLCITVWILEHMLEGEEGYARGEWQTREEWENEDVQG